MLPTAPTEGELRAIHEALIEGCGADLARACGGRRSDPDAVALILLPHGSPEAQIACGSRAEVAREIAFFAVDEGPAVTGLGHLCTELARRAPPRAGRLLCVVVARGHGRIHEIAWPSDTPPPIDA